MASTKTTSTDYEREVSLFKEDPTNYWMQKTQSVHWFSSPLNSFNEIEPDNDYSSKTRWFSDGLINACYNCVDVHVKNGLGENTAIIHRDDFNGIVTEISYKELLVQVSKFAGVLKKIGVEKGDRVLISMPTVPQAQIAILSCSRIGAVSVVVFNAFPPAELAQRIDHIKPKVVIAASCGFEGMKMTPCKPMVDEGIQLAMFKPQKVIIFQRKQLIAKLNPTIDLDWQKEMESAEAVDCVKLKATDILYIIYTSGTTGGYKGLMKDHGGYMVALKWFMTDMLLMQHGQVFTSDCPFGWAPSMSARTYGTFLVGGTSLLYEASLGEALFQKACH